MSILNRIATYKRNRYQYRRRWHRWFAWYPVRVHGCFTMCRTLERKGDYCWSGRQPRRLRWFYRFIDEGVQV